MTIASLRLLLYELLFSFTCITAVRAQTTHGDTTAAPMRQKIALGAMAGYITNGQQWPLPGATISAMDQETGLFLKHALSDENGRFALRGIPVGRQLELRVSYTGFLDTSALFMIRDTVKPLWTGTWVLRELTKELEAVSVTRRKPPFIVKKDTLEFDARQFKTLPNDVVKDLLRKLPGMQIDIYGNVSLNGKPVDRIKVDGRDFMGGNLRSALDNLPGAIIDKVQVTDTRDPGEENTSVVKKPGKSYTLNLTIRKENKVGLLGNAEVAAGSPGRAWGKGFFNAMKGPSRLTIEAGGSNVNKLSGGSTSTEEVMRGDPMNHQMALDGIVRRGLGASADFSTKVRKADVDAMYSVTGNRLRAEETTDRQVFLPDSGFSYRSYRGTDKDENGQSLRSYFDIPIDSLQRVRGTVRGSYADKSSLTNETARTLTPHELPVNSQQNALRDASRDRGLDASISYDWSSRNHLSHIYLFSTQTWRGEKGTQDIRALNRFYQGGDSTTTTLAQHGDIDNKGYGHYASFSVKHELSSKLALLAGYRISYSRDDNRKQVLMLDSVTGKFDKLDTSLSVHFLNTSITHDPSLGIGYSGSKLTVELNGGISFVRRDNLQPEKDNALRIRQKIWSPNASIGYQFNPFARQSLSYMFRTEQPAPEQLAPVPDNSNPLVLKLGNPGLKTGAVHSVTTGFAYNNPSTGIMVNSEVVGNLQKNMIVANNFFDSLGRQVLSFSNVDNIHSAVVAESVGWTRMRSEWRFTINAACRYYYAVSKGFVNRQENATRTTMWMPEIGLTLGYKEKIELFGVFQPTFSDVSYSLPGNAPTRYHTMSSMARLTYNVVSGMKITSDLEYFYNSMIPAAFGRSSTIVTSRVDYSFLNGQRMTVYCLASDIFNRSNPVSRNITPTEIQTVSSRLLRRCVLVGVRYRFDKFEKKQGDRAGE